MCMARLISVILAPLFFEGEGMQKFGVSCLCMNAGVPDLNMLPEHDDEYVLALLHIKILSKLTTPLLSGTALPLVPFSQNDFLPLSECRGWFF